MTKEILIILLQNNFWDIVDKFMDENNEYFHAISTIYNSCIKECEIKGPSILALIANGILFIFFYNAKYDVNLTLKDAFFSYAQFENRANKAMDYETFLDETEIILNWYKYYLPTFNLIQTLYLLKNTLYKSKIFEDLFIDKVSTYIMEEYVKGNLSIEFIEIILKW